LQDNFLKGHNSNPLPPFLVTILSTSDSFPNSAS